MISALTVQIFQLLLIPINNPTKTIMQTFYHLPLFCCDVHLCACGLWRRVFLSSDGMMQLFQCPGSSPGDVLMLVVGGFLGQLDAICACFQAADC